MMKREPEPLINLSRDEVDFAISALAEATNFFYSTDRYDAVPFIFNLEQLDRVREMLRQAKNLVTFKELLKRQENASKISSAAGSNGDSRTSSKQVKQEKQRLA